MAGSTLDFNASSARFDSAIAFNSASTMITAKCKILSNLEKKQIAHILSLNYNNQKLKYGVIKKIALDYGVSRITVCTIWKDVLKPIKDGVLPNVERKYKGGYKRYSLDLENGICTFDGKIMFMSAVARPRYDENGICTFDGKIGILPFTVMEPAIRASKNRAKGVMEVKPIESINKVVIKRCLLEKVIPAIKAKWPTFN